MVSTDYELLQGQAQKTIPIYLFVNHFKFNTRKVSPKMMMFQRVFPPKKTTQNVNEAVL